MFYTAKLTNSLFRPSVFSYLMQGQKVFKTLDFWFINTWNNVDQLQRSGSCSQMSDVGILSESNLASNPFGRTRVSISLSICVCHFGRIRGRILPTQIQPYDILIQDPLGWNWSTLFELTINQKSSILNFFFLMHQGKNGRKLMA